MMGKVIALVGGAVSFVDGVEPVTGLLWRHLDRLFGTIWGRFVRLVGMSIAGILPPAWCTAAAARAA